MNCLRVLLLAALIACGPDGEPMPAPLPAAAPPHFCGYEDLIVRVFDLEPPVYCCVRTLTAATAHYCVLPDGRVLHRPTWSNLKARLGEK